MWTKICANTNLPDARLAAELGADAVGFVFAESKRRVTVEQAAAITAGLPDLVEKVGAFSTTDADEIEHSATAAGLTMVQLHSAYDPSLTKRLCGVFGGEIKLIQVVPYELHAEDRALADRRFTETLMSAASDPALWAVLIDAAKSGASGGLGVSFDWGHVAELVSPVTAKREAANILLAGGLRAENVRTAIGALRPFGVDVASGVELRPGRKSEERMRSFLRAATAR